MAKTTGNVLGNQRGKIGKVVGKVVEGQQIYSAYSGKGKDPRTPKQVAHRARFSSAVAMGKALKGVLNVGLRNIAASRKLQSPYNVFVRNSMNHISYDAGQELTTIDYANITLADGGTPTVQFGTADYSVAKKITVAYTGGDSPGAYDEDSVYVVAYAPAFGHYTLGFAARSAGNITVEVSTDWVGTTVHLWGFVRTKVDEPTYIDSYGIRLKPYECSRSSYLGSGTIAGA